MSIDLVVTDEQAQLRDTVRSLLADKAPVRVALDQGDYDPAVWSLLADLGLQALIVPEAYGGLGQGAVESWIVFEEMGRALYSGPLLASAAMATNALLASGDEGACADLLPKMATGETVATLAVTERDGRWDGGRDEQTVATAKGGAHPWDLRGSKTFVVDGTVADLILVTARTDEGTSLFAVEATAAGVTRRRLDTLDLTRQLAELTFCDAPARLVGALGSAEPVVDAVLDHVLVVVAAESVGGMRACLDMCVDYAKTRKQFGVPIGSFQAVAHKCVDMLQRAEFAGSAVQYAAAAQAEGSDDSRLAVRVAAAYCGPAYHWVTAETIQIHGGLGFTWAHDAHLYYRRCRSTEQLFGPAGGHLDAVAERAGL